MMQRSLSMVQSCGRTALYKQNSCTFQLDNYFVSVETRNPLHPIIGVSQQTAHS